MIARLRTEWLILHCSDTEDGSGGDWDAIRDYHMTAEEDGGPKGGPWEDVGYHFGIELVGTEYVIRRGRPVQMVGAHCHAEGRNRDSIGVCVVGKFDVHPPSFRLHAVVAGLLATLCLIYGIDPDHVKGHREFEPGKTCPGSAWRMDVTRELVRMKLYRSETITEPHLRALGFAGI